MLYMVTLSVALTTALVVFVAVWAFPARSRSLRRRLVALGLDGSGSVLEEARRDRNRGMIEGLIRVLGERIAERRDDAGPLRTRLIHAGYRDVTAVPIFLGTSAASALGGLVLAFTLGTVLGYAGVMVLFIAAWGAVLGWVVPHFVLSGKVTARKKEIQVALPDALDLLVICVEAGLGLNQALVRVAAEMRHVSDVMTEEIGLTNLQIRAGTPRPEALRNLAKRTGVPDLRSLVSMLIQTEQFGTSIARSLRIHASTLREKRRQRAEEAAAKTTIKMIFPLVFCIFPALFVVVLAPAIIQIFITLSKMG